MESKKLLLIDGYNLFHRSYYGVIPTLHYLSPSTGEMNNGVFGFARTLFNVLQKEKPEYVVVALDPGFTGRSFRHALYPEYKAQRKETPSELTGQMKRAWQLCEALGIQICRVPIYEADDIIGIVARQVYQTEPSVTTLILSNDQDLLQLVNDRVYVLTQSYLKSAAANAESSSWPPSTTDALGVFGPAQFVEKYGFSPQYLADYKALSGDASDNIPGVPGVGPVAATALIKQFGHVDEILTGLRSLAGDVVKFGQSGLSARAVKSVLAHEAELVLYKTLTTIVTDPDTAEGQLSLPLELDKARAGRWDFDEVFKLLKQLNLHELLGRQLEALALASDVLHQP